MPGELLSLINLLLGVWNPVRPMEALDLWTSFLLVCLKSTWLRDFLSSCSLVSWAWGSGWFCLSLSLISSFWLSISCFLCVFGVVLLSVCFWILPWPFALAIFLASYCCIFSSHDLSLNPFRPSISTCFAKLFLVWLLRFLRWTYFILYYLASTPLFRFIIEGNWAWDADAVGWCCLNIEILCYVYPSLLPSGLKCWEASAIWSLCLFFLSKFVLEIVLERLFKFK